MWVRDLMQLTFLLAGFSSSQVIGLSSLARGCLHEQLTTWQLAPLRSQSQGKWARWKPDSFLNLISEVTPSLLPYLLEASHNVQPSIERKALHKDVNTRKWGSWEPSWRLRTTFCCHLRNALWMIITWEAQIRGWTNLEKERDVGKILWGRRLFSWTLMGGRIRSHRSEWNMFIGKEIAPVRTWSKENQRQEKYEIWYH